MDSRSPTPVLSVSPDAATPSALAALQAAFMLLLERAQTDTALRKGLRDAAEAVLTLFPAEQVAPPIEQPTLPLIPPASEEDLRRLEEHFQHGFQIQNAYEPPEIELFEAEQVIANCRLKLRACEWLEEHGYTSDDEALAQRNSLIDEGRRTDCYLWMFMPSVINPNATAVHRCLVDNFKVLADTLEFWSSCEEEDEIMEGARLLAEAQSALRLAVSRGRGEEGAGQYWFDPEQKAVFSELRLFAEEQSVYLEYLTLEQPADPNRAGERLERLKNLRERREMRLEAQKNRRKILSKVRYHAGLLEKGSRSPEHDWQRLGEAVETFIEGGGRESDLELRSFLRSLYGKAPAEIPHEGLRRAFASLEGATHGGGTQSVMDTVSISREVIELSQLIEGQSVVMIGGDERPGAREAIERAFGCRLIWLSTRAHQSTQSFKPVVAREDVRLVLLLIRWSSHAFSDVSHYCAEYDKLFVRVSGGYGVNSLAHSIMNQVGRQLGSFKA